MGNEPRVEQTRAMRLQPPFDLRRAWREAPSVAGATALRWTNVSFWLLAGVVGLVSTRMLDWEGGRTGALAVLALGAIALGGVILAAGDRFPGWLYHGTLTLGLLAVTLAVLLADGAAPALALSSLFLFVMVDASLMFTLRAAVAYVVGAGVAAGATLHHHGVATGVIVLAEGSRIGTTVVVAWLARVADGAERDPLTGLANRRGFDRRMEEAMRAADHGGAPFAVAVLDIDRFKRVNDRHGHQEGDRLLVRCAEAWRPLVPAGACLARYGGDEFALLLPGVGVGRAADLVDDLRRAVAGSVGVSAGVAAWDPGDSGSMLMNRADVALYEAKATGRGRASVYGDPHRSASELEAAIAEGQLELVFQPIVRLETAEVIGHEALARWHHPERGLVMPERFVPLAERTGAIHALGRWAVATACRTLAAAAEPRAPVGVNVSTAELRSPHYAASVLDQLDAHELRGDALVLEVTEGAFDDDDPHVLRNVAALRERGVLVAMDDFGSGYSSLRRLAHLSIDVLKLDGALVRSIREDDDDAPILRAIATMAQALGHRLVAERIETQHQAELLRRLGYDYGQGYLFGRPAPYPAGPVGPVGPADPVGPVDTAESERAPRLGQLPG